MQKEKKEQKGPFKRILNPVPSNCGRGRPLGPLGGGEGIRERRGGEASRAALLFAASLNSFYRPKRERRDEIPLTSPRMSYLSPH